MGKVTSVLLAIALSVAASIQGFAATSDTIEVTVESETAFMADSEKLTLKNKDGDVLLPLYYDSTVYYPVTILNSVEDERITITGNPQNGEKVKAKLYKDYSVIVDDEEVALKKPFAKVHTDLYPIAYKGTWYLPNTILGYVKYADGTVLDNCGIDKKATWDSKEKTITITTVEKQTTSSATVTPAPTKAESKVETQTAKKEIGGIHKDDDLKVVIPLSEISPQSVFWGHTGDKVHISPNCSTFKNGVLFGSLQDCKDAGHTKGWCQRCSAGWSDQKLTKDGNPYTK